MSTVTLPPGFYEIHTHTEGDGNKKKVLTPRSIGLVVITGTSPESASWQITSDGLIVAFDQYYNANERSNKSGTNSDLANPESETLQEEHKSPQTLTRREHHHPHGTREDKTSRKHDTPSDYHQIARQYQTLTNNKPCRAGDKVTTSQEGGMRWVIYGVEYISGNTWTGSIMTNDGTKLFWTIDSSDNSVYLRQYTSSCISTIPKFHFVPVNPHDGTPLNQHFPTWGRWDRFSGKNPSLALVGIGILEAILTLVIINLYVIMEMARGNQAGRFTEILPPWLRKDRY